MINPIFKNGPIFLIGLNSDFESAQLVDGLVVEINVDDRLIVNLPWSFQKKLKFSGYYEFIPESDRMRITNQLTDLLGQNLIDEIIDLLVYPPDESIDSLIWLPERLKDRNALKVYRPIKSSVAEFEVDENNIEKEFARLSDLLLLNKCLKINNTRFNFTEIEFYYYCDKHQDAFTHKHDQLPKKWRFHNQGLDITLRGITGFGGILIRGIEKVSESENGKSIFINGPRRILFEVMNYLNPIDQLNNEFGIINCDRRKLTIFKTFRHGLDSPNPDLCCSNVEYFRKAQYRFIVNPKLFDKTQFIGAEDIARNFNNKDMAYEFLGYNLSL